jgi:hypothetical protein
MLVHLAAQNDPKTVFNPCCGAHQQTSEARKQQMSFRQKHLQQSFNSLSPLCDLTEPDFKPVIKRDDQELTTDMPDVHNIESNLTTAANAEIHAHAFSTATKAQ